MSKKAAPEHPHDLDEQRATERLAELYLSDSRSPLHPKALRTKDMIPGRKIIYFNLEFGITDEHTVVVEPHPHHVSELPSVLDGSIVVTTKPTDSASDSAASDRFCVDMGLQPYSGGSWSRRNFTIDASDRHLLPEQTSKPDRENFPFNLVW